MRGPGLASLEVHWQVQNLNLPICQMPVPISGGPAWARFVFKLLCRRRAWGLPVPLAAESLWAAHWQWHCGTS